MLRQNITSFWFQRNLTSFNQFVLHRQFFFFQKASDHELEELFYDKFEVTLDDVQVMIFDKGK